MLYSLFLNEQQKNKKPSAASFLLSHRWRYLRKNFADVFIESEESSQTWMT